MSLSKVMASIALFLILAPSTLGQQPGTGDAQSAQENLKKVLDASCELFDIRCSKDDEVLEGKVVFRWDNPERGSTAGCTAIWTGKDKTPMAIASIYPTTVWLQYDFDILNRDVGCVGKMEGKEFWRTPRSAKLEFKPLAGAGKPPASARLREAQLKHLATQFTVDLLGWRLTKSNRQRLRMLTTPIHQYGSTKDDSEVILGGIFLFVLGVDPEAAVVLEAHKQDDGEYRWEYAVVPQTSAAFEVKHKKNVIWKKAVNATVPGHGHISKTLPAEARTR